jgi:hypothetical protein
MPTQADKMTDDEKAAARRLLIAIKTWWLAPLGNDSVEIDEVVWPTGNGRQRDEGRRPADPRC